MRARARQPHDQTGGARPDECRDVLRGSTSCPRTRC